MAPAKDLYIALRDDPNLEVPEGDTRESAAWKETAQRTRQHHTNAKALGMASEVKENSAVEKFADFLKKAKPSSFDATPVGPFPTKGKFNEAVQFSFKGPQSTAASVSKIVAGMNKKQRETLARNVHEYFKSATDEGEHDLHTEMSDWSSSLPEEDTANLLNHLASSRKPFTANSSIDSAELKSKGYIDTASAKGGHKLTVQGAAHLISGNMKTSGQKPFIISPANFNKTKKDISDPESWSEIAPKKLKPPKTLKDKQKQLAREMTKDDIFENQTAAERTIRETTNEDTDFEEHRDKIETYFNDMGGHYIGSHKKHIDNINNGETKTVPGHISETAAAEIEAKAPEEKFKAINIYDQGRFTGKDFTSEGKLNPELFEEGGEFDDLTDAQKEHLQGITFESGKNYKVDTDLNDAVKPKATKKPATTPAATPTTKPKPAAETAPSASKLENTSKTAGVEQDSESLLDHAEKRLGGEFEWGGDWDNPLAVLNAINGGEMSFIDKDPKHPLSAEKRERILSDIFEQHANSEYYHGDSDSTPDPIYVANMNRYLDDVENDISAAEASTPTATPKAKNPAGEKPAGEKPAKEETTEEQATAEETAKLPQAEANSIMDVLNEHHNEDNAGKTTPEGTAFNALKDKLAPKLLRGELDQDDIKDISEHLATHGKDTAVVNASGSVSLTQITDVLRAGNAKPPPTPPDKPVGEGEGVGDGDEPTSSEPSTPANTGTGDTGVDAADAQADQAAAVDTEFESLFEQHKDKFQNMYDAAGHDEDMFSFEDFKETEAAEYKKKGSSTYRKNFSNAFNKHKKDTKAAEKAKETAAATVENKAKKDGVAELHQKLREAGHRATKADAAALYEANNGDIDAAVKQKDDDKEKQEAAVEAANKLPDGVDSPDAIKQSLFGDTNPTGLLAGSLPTRSENKHGAKANQMARDLLIHAQTHQDNLSTKTRKAIVDNLAILTDPESNIKGFKANKGEKFADLDHVANQIKQAVDDDIDVNSPEAQQTFQSQDIKLQEERQNFSAKHLDGISDSYAVESPAAAAKTVGRAAGKVAGAVKRGDAKEKEHKSESHARIWDHGTPNHTESFDEDGNSKGRSKFDHTKGEAVYEKTETGETTGAKGFQDTIHHSPVKEHHGTLTAKQEESMSKLRQAHKDGDSDAIEEHRSDLKDSGLSRSDFEHHEDDMPKSGPPDKEVAIYMQGQGYEWHEDTRRWRHKETDDNYRKSNGATKGTFASGSHSETGAHGYMATAEMGADGKVSATPDTGNYAVTPAGTHGVSSDLGGSPPTSAQGVQGHVLGHALNNAGVSHDGTSKSFPMSHLNGTGIHDSKHYDKPSGVKAAAKRGAGAAYRAATGGGAKAYMDRTKKNWSSPLVSSSSPLSQTLGRAGKIGAGLVRDVFGKSDISELTAVELLQYHVALQKAEEKTNLRV